MADDKPVLINKTIEDDFNWEQLHNNLKDEDFTSMINEPTLEEFGNSGFFDRTLIVSNTPVIEEKFVSKLHNVLTNLLRHLEKPEQLNIVCQDGKTTGLVIIVLSSKELAEEYFDFLKGYNLDKKHKLVARMYTDLLRIKKAPVESSSSSLVSMKFSMEEANAYLKNQESEGFSVVKKSETETTLEYYTYSKNQRDFIATEIEKGIVVAAKWSPKGTFMAVLSQQRVNLYIGPINNHFKLVNTYPIPKVVFLKFSPDERFVAFSSTDGRRKKITIYDTVNGHKYWEKSSIPSTSVIQLEWNSDSTKMVFVLDKRCSIFKSDEMKIIKSYQLPKDASNYELLPYSMTMMYSKPLPNDTGVNIFQKSLIDDSPEKILKIMFSVKEASFYTQNKELYVAIFSTKLVKKCTTYIIDIADFTKREFSIHSLELKHPVGKLIWEPNGNHFVITCSEQVSFYKVHETGVKLIFVMTVRDPRIEWNPAGKFLYFYNKKQNYFEMGFCNGHTGEIYKTYRTTNAEFSGWDSSGRYCSTTVSMNKTRSDNSAVIWGCSGSQMKHFSFKNLLAFMWRPRKEILSETEIKASFEKLPQYCKEFAETDRKFLADKAKEMKIFRSHSIMKFYENLFERRELVVS